MSDHMPSPVDPEVSPAVHPELVEGSFQSEVRVAQLQAELQRVRHTLGHDLCAPLRHIAGFVQVIQEDHGSTLPAEVRQHLDTIANAAAQMRGLVDALLKDLPAAD